MFRLKLMLLGVIAPFLVVLGVQDSAQANTGAFDASEYTQIANGDTLDEVLANCNCTGHEVASAHICGSGSCDDWTGRNYNANWHTGDTNRDVTDIEVVFKWVNGAWRVRMKSKAAGIYTQGINNFGNSGFTANQAYPGSIWVAGTQWDPRIICGGCGGGNWFWQGDQRPGKADQ